MSFRWQSGCIADYEANTDIIDRMKTGQTLTVQAIHMNGQAISQQLDLRDFAKAYDGPPTEPAAFKERQEEEQEQSLRPLKDDTPQPHLRPER